MKIVGRMLALLALCVCGTASAQQAPVPGPACVPYTIPVQSTVTSCGPGLMGSKYKTTTKECPSGRVTESADFDTSGCVVAPVGSGGSVSPAVRCKLTPDACANSPVAAACPAGHHWTMMGSDVAHCVQDDPVCAWGTSLTHDRLGNPSCVANTCPSNQVLQADGKSCGCSGGLEWNGSSCVVPTPTCYEGSGATRGSTCTYGGTKYYIETTTCPAGAYGPPSTSGYWDESGCAAAPVPSCWASTRDESAACPSGYTGTQYREVSISCPNGPYGSPSTSYGVWNDNSCADTCTPRQSRYFTSCGSGYTGTKYVITHFTCGPPGSWTEENTSGCGCANGGTNYPTCTPPPPPPPPATCETVYGSVAIGTTATRCDINYQQYPRGEVLQCTKQGWQVRTGGDPTLFIDCD